MARRMRTDCVRKQVGSDMNEEIVRDLMLAVERAVSCGSTDSIPDYIRVQAVTVS
jgi:hypothetical protein